MTAGFQNGTEGARRNGCAACEYNILYYIGLYLYGTRVAKLQSRQSRQERAER